MTGVLEYRSCSADWISLQPQTFQTYREALRLSTEPVTFLITVSESRVEIRSAIYFLALGGTSLALFPRSIRVAEKNTLC